MSAEFVRCRRCGTEWRGQDGWNDDHIAGPTIGHLCPDCQSSEEDTAALINLMFDPPTPRGSLNIPTEGPSVLINLAEGLIHTYQTPEVLRSKADTLSSARKDKQATVIARFMRRLADDVESGALCCEEPDGD